MTPPPPTDPGPVEQWPSYTYWTESPARRAQHWYICFCLMMSSTQDWLTGVALKDAENLNWSATASYYSTVHCGRLLCFIACGDFPKQHNLLRNLFVPGTPSTRPSRVQRPLRPRQGDCRYVECPLGSGSSSEPAADSPREQHQFNWLKGFSGGRYDTDERPGPHEQGAAIRKALGMLAPSLAGELDDLCPRFAPLGALRNDSNYESLLIAHEFNHPLVSEQFTLLSDRALALAERAARLSRDIFLTYVERDGRLAGERRAFRAATAAYFDGRLRPAIESKISCSPTARVMLEQFVNVPATAGLGSDDHINWGTIENRISMDLFDPKTSLMRAFEDKVAALE